MARKKRTFVESDDMRKEAEKLLQKYQGYFFGLVDPDLIKFALITDEKAKNAKPAVVEEVAKDWIQEETKKVALVAFYHEDWQIWSTPRKQFELLEALQNLPIGVDGKKHKPDVQDYRWRINFVGSDWREKNDQGKDLPDLIDVEDVGQVAGEEESESTVPADELEFPTE